MKTPALTEETPIHPMEEFLRMDRMPHIWCSSCGIGTAVNCFAAALRKAKLDLDKVSIVSGIGCTGRAAGYLNLDSYHTTHGRAIPFAAGLKLARPDLSVVVFSGDGDLMAIGGNHFIHAARRNLDLTVICVNNFNYAMTGGQAGPTTPLTALATTSPYGCFDAPFNLPFLAESCGAVYVARWTVLDFRRLTESMMKAMAKPGFTFIEVIAPCATLYARRNRLGDGRSLLKFYHDYSEIQHGASTRDVDIAFQQKIICGEFVDRSRPTFLENMNRQFAERLGDRYHEYKGCLHEEL
jgi:2-oxoglutarate ferredoxin oxidoreductase subunit beta